MPVVAIDQSVPSALSSRVRRQLNGYSLVLLLGLAVSLILSLFFKESWLWMDEVLGITLLTDPSLAHMNDAIVGYIDANPPLFYNVYWPIAHAISLSPFFLRGVSVVLFATAVTLFYRYTTRLVGTPVSNFILFTVVLSLTYLNYTLATQVRVYSFYLFLSGFYFMVLHQLIRSPARFRLLAGQLLLGLALLLTHNFGAFYVAASLSFFGLLALWSKRRAYGLVVGTHLLAFGLWFLLWFPRFQIQSQAAKPHTWIPLPTFSSFFRIVGELIPTLSSRLEQQPALSFLPLLRVGLVVGLLLYLALPRLKRGVQSLLNDDAFSLFVLSGYLILAVAVGGLIVSYAYASVFISRYQWPGTLLLLYLLTYAWHQVGRLPVRVPKPALWVPVYALGIFAFVFYQNRKIVQFPSGIVQYLPPNPARYPIFVESADYFLPLHHHHVANVHFLLNWPLTLTPGNLPNATTDYKIISSMRDKYGVREIVPAGQFTGSNYPHFYVVDEASRPQIEHYIATGQVKVIRTIPVPIDGHRILECTF